MAAPAQAPTKLTSSQPPNLPRRQGSARVIRCLQDSRASLSSGCTGALFDHEVRGGPQPTVSSAPDQPRIPPTPDPLLNR
jgi:hypothetical protein